MKLVFISDTHICAPYNMKLPKGDILIHSGDYCNSGRREDLQTYILWLKVYKNKFDKIIQVSGNHDFIAEKEPAYVRDSFFNEFGDKLVYLQDQEYVIGGTKFYGSPWQPRFHDWAFNVNRGADIKRYWDEIPEDTDVLITHGPPKMILDRCMDGYRAGCVDLWNRIEQIQPKFHAFGHIHEGYGKFLYQWDTGKFTHFINASICDEDYNPINKPIVVEI